MSYNYALLFLYFLIWLAFIYSTVTFFGGLKKNISYLFSMGIFFVYQFLTPLYGLSQGWYGLFGLDLSESLTKVIMIYTMSVFFVSLAYLLSIKLAPNVKIRCESKYDKIITPEVGRKWIVISLLSIVIWSIISGYGIGRLFLINIFSESRTSLLDENNQSYLYLKQCFEFSITGILIAFSSKMKRKEFVFWLVLVLIVTLGFGFRYRLIILSCAIVIYFILNNRIDYKMPIKIAVLMSVLISSLYLVGETRNYYKSINRGYDEVQEISISTSEPVTTKVLKYTRNYLSDAALIKYIDDGYDDYDYGHSMFAQTFIRLVPSSLYFGEKPRPYSLAASAQSWHSLEGFYAGEAFSYVGEFYYSFGIVGVAMLSILLGWILSFLRVRRKTRLEALFISLSISSLFHYYSRGYLPGYFMSYLFLIIPFIFIKFRLKI